MRITASARQVRTAIAIAATLVGAPLLGHLSPTHAIGASNVTIDTTYGTNGFTEVAFGSATVNNLTKALIQPDDKVVLVGAVNSGGTYPTDYDIALSRLNADGSIDTSFGTNGKVVTKPHTGNGLDDYVYTSALQPDGMILVAGGYTISGTNTDVLLARYTSAGVLDTTFGTNGLLTTSVSASEIERVYGIALQADGKIVVTGFTDTSGAGSMNNDWLTMRYSSAGVLDSTFGTGGKVITSMGGLTDQAETVAIQPDGKIVVGGSADSNFAVVRYTSAGILDTSFGTGGIMTQSSTYTSEPVDIKILSNGKILCGGYITYAAPRNTEMLVTQLNSDGTLDTSFGTNGNAIVGSSTNSYDRISSLLVQSDGSIIAGGYTNNFSDNPWNTDVEVLRLNADGTVDTTFGTGTTNGLLVLDPGAGLTNNSESSQSILQQSNGKLILAGQNGPTMMLSSNFFAMRVQNLTTVPTTPTVAPASTTPSNNNSQSATTTIPSASNTALAATTTTVISSSTNSTSPSTSGKVSSFSVKKMTDETAPAGGTITIESDGFTQNETVNVLMGSSAKKIASTKANSSGVASAKVFIPTSMSGRQTIAMYAPVSGKGFRQSITVTSELPATGSDSSGIVMWAVILLSLGGVLVFRRKVNA